MVTTGSGETYRVSGHGSWGTAQLDQLCKHLALRHMLELYEAEPERTKRLASHVIRRAEYNHTDARVHVTRGDGWRV
jgi:hypothetical protein